MKNVFCLLTLALMIGCGGADQGAITPEKEKELNTKMQDDMQKMTSELGKTPGAPAPEAKE